MELICAYEMLYSEIYSINSLNTKRARENSAGRRGITLLSLIVWFLQPHAQEAIDQFQLHFAMSIIVDIDDYSLWFG